MNNIQPQETQILNSEAQEFLPKMPDELALNILQYLTPKQLLLGACLVSKKWKELAKDEHLWQSFDLKTIFPHTTHINEEAWARHVNMEKFGLSFKGLKRLDIPKAIPKILKVASLKKERKGITILSVPSGLSLVKLKEILSSSSDFRRLCFFSRRGSSALAPLKSETIMHPYQVVITNSHIADETYRYSFEKQNELLTQLGCKMPDLVSISVQIGMAYLSSGTRFYRQTELHRNYKFSACSNVIEGELPYTFAGNFLEAQINLLTFEIAAFDKRSVDELPYKFGSAAMINLSEEAGIESNQKN